MANQNHLDILSQGVTAWNRWREENPSVEEPDLSETNLAGEELNGVNLSQARLMGANLNGAKLSRANLDGAVLELAHLNRADLSESTLIKARLPGAMLQHANLSYADMREAVFEQADLFRANLFRANLKGARLPGVILRNSDLRKADLSNAVLEAADLHEADLSNAILEGADLLEANFSGAILKATNLRGANLMHAILVETDLENANLSGCAIYGISAWNLKLAGADQSNLKITRPSEPAVTLDNVKVAQFIYLLLDNKEIRDVIDTIGKKAVLILGRFTEGRKSVLDAIREELRKSGYLPILFDFDKPTSRDLTETIATLAHMARFIVADITDAKSIPQELQAIVPNLPSVPVQPIIARSANEYGMFEHFRRYPWVLKIYQYDDSSHLLAALRQEIIAPLEAKVTELLS
jgi:uncharacterized protein YjbI with pentapeptide repeats